MSLGGIPADATKTDLIPGDPEGLETAATVLRQYAHAFHDAAARIDGLDTSTWEGDAADGFRNAVKVLPKHFGEAQSSFSDAASALFGFVEVLRTAQAKVPALLEDAADARATSVKYQHKVEDYNAAVERGDLSLPSRPSETDPGASAMNDCVSRLRTLRAEVASAGAVASQKLRKASEAAPDEPGMLDKAWGALRSFGTGVGESLWGMGEMAVQFSPVRMLVDPGGFAMDVATTIDGVIWGAQHPKEFGKAIVDWDMWQEDPARALGRLVPDIAATAASGGAAAAAKGGRAGSALSRLGLNGLRAVPEARLSRLGPQDEWLTGARRRPRDILDDPAQTKWAEDAYADFMRDDRDIGSISDNTRDVARGDGSYGFSEEEIASIKKHVFDTEHPIEDYETGEVVTRKFDADAEIADAWIRLRAGRSLPEDSVLLEHELTELGYLRDHPGVTYQEAHRVANGSYNWQSKVPLDKREDFESEW